MVGSLANLIALRLAQDPRLWLRFHGYSVPFLLLSCTLVLWLAPLEEGGDSRCSEDALNECST